MWIALCTVTVRLTTLAKAFGEGAAKKPLAGSQLRDPRAKFAFGRREARAMKSRINWFLHLRLIYYLRLAWMSTHKMQCEFAQHLKKGPTVGESNTWITQKTSLRNQWYIKDQISGIRKTAGWWESDGGKWLFADRLRRRSRQNLRRRGRNANSIRRSDFGRVATFLKLVAEAVAQGNHRLFHIIDRGEQMR